MYNLYCYFCAYNMLHYSATLAVWSLNKVNKVAAAEFALTCSHRYPSRCSELLLSASLCSLSKWSVSSVSHFYTINSNPHISLFPVTWSPEKVSQTSPPIQDLLLPTLPASVPDSQRPCSHWPRPTAVLPAMGWRWCSLLGQTVKDQSGRIFISLIPLNPSTPAFSFVVRRQPVAFQVHVRRCFHMLVCAATPVNKEQHDLEEI